MWTISESDKYRNWSKGKLNYKRRRFFRVLFSIFHIFLVYYIFIPKTPITSPHVLLDFYLEGYHLNNGLKYFSLKHLIHDLPRKHLLYTVHVKDIIQRKKGYVHIDEQTKHLYTCQFPRSIFDADIIEEEATVVDAHFACLRDIFVNPACTTTDGEFLYVPKNYSGFPFNQIYEQYTGTFNRSIKNLIAFGHLNTFIYGHFFLDVVMPLTIIPEEMLEDSKVLVNDDSPYVVETLKIFGLEDCIVLIPEDSWFYVHNLYVAYDPMPHVSHLGPCLVKFTKKFKKYYKIDPYAEANQYCLMNRYPEVRRSIKDFESFEELVRKTFPNIEWNTLYDFYTIKDAANIYNTIKFLFAPTGSNLIHILFMQPDTVVVSAQCDYNDYTMESLAVASMVHMFVFASPGNNHHLIQPMILSFPDAIRIIQQALELCESL